jgi:ABC-type Fe3+ transport system permease subunit
VTGPKNAEGEFDWEAASGRIALAIIEILLRIATIVSLGYVVYGGFRYITSQGEPDATKSARQTIINAMIGLVIALLATGIVAFVANRLTTSSPTTNVNGPR